ncbi:conserved hypothetical protein [Vibrio sp. 16]|nr:conserved hypothetical protein [Vibrio sp. 16]
MEKSLNKWLKNVYTLVSVDINKANTKSYISMRPTVMNIHHHHHPV